MDTSENFLDLFSNEISQIDDTDYGDYMRKVNHALLLLKDKIYDESTSDVKESLDELQYTIQFHPNWDILSTRKKVSMVLSTIRQQLALEATTMVQPEEFNYNVL